MLWRLSLTLALLAAAALGYWWWARRQGRVERVTSQHVPGALTQGMLGAPHGRHATFVQFSTPMCAKCPPTRELLQRVAAERPHVKHVEIDAAERLELARELHIMRTPTTLVLDSDGVVVARMNGAMTESQARQALDAVPPPAEYSI